MPTINRALLRSEFDAAVDIINQRGSKLTTEWYRQIGDAVFDAGCLALEDASATGTTATTVTASIASTQSPFAETEGYQRPIGRLHVVSAPVGSGKTSFSQAFVTAVVRVAEQDSAAPYGCLIVIDQMPKADRMYRELSALLPGKVAVWTTDHDPACKAPTKVMDEGRVRFTKDDLQRFPVAIVTHKFFSGKGSHKATQVLRGDRLRPRALTVIDERLDEVTVFDIELSAAVRVREMVQQDEKAAATIGPHIDALVRFMADRSFISGADIEKPTDAQEAWSIAEQLEWFTTGAASAYVKAHHGDPDVIPVFGFGRALANGYAFIARNRGGEQGTHFIGYESNLVAAPGTMLLDATADIDGVSQVCPWREHRPTPQARYDNLSIIHVPAHTKMRLKNYFKSLRNRQSYVTWMQATIREHMAPGQRGLVVCKKTLFDNENIPIGPEGNPRLISEQWGWNIDGRKLCATHWGTGIGDNIWKDADVVFLFDEFWVPRRTVIATAQGLQQHKSTEGDLGTMTTLNSKARSVDTLQEGHLLRWTKQMALRGRGRSYDDQGVCGLQKLVCSGDLRRLLSHADDLFPGAQISHVKAKADTDQRTTKAHEFLAIMSRQGLPDKITTNWIGQQLGKPWRNVSKHIMPLEDVQRSLANLRWTYVSQKGRGGAHFVRTQTAMEAAMLAA